MRSVFRGSMDGRSDFPFSFLQPTGAGTRTLMLPSISFSFRWTAQQVTKLISNCIISCIPQNYFGRSTAHACTCMYMFTCMCSS